MWKFWKTNLKPYVDIAESYTRNHKLLSTKLDDGQKHAIIQNMIAEEYMLIEIGKSLDTDEKKKINEILWETYLEI